MPDAALVAGLWKRSVDANVAVLVDAHGFRQCRSLGHRNRGPPGSVRIDPSSVLSGGQERIPGNAPLRIDRVNDCPSQIGHVVRERAAIISRTVGTAAG